MTKVTDRAALDAAVGGDRTAVLFHATWCPYCRSFRPVFERVTGGSRWTAVEAVVDDEDNPLWEDYTLDVVPTVVFFENGTPVRRLDGRRGSGLTEKQLQDALG